METIDSSKQYSLRWEKHAFNLAAEAGYFFEDESFLDCTLSAEGQCIEAHKIILSASSSYLSVSEKHKYKAELTFPVFLLWHFSYL